MLIRIPEPLQRSKYDRELTVKFPLNILPLKDIADEVQPKSCLPSWHQLQRIIYGWSDRRAGSYLEVRRAEVIKVVGSFESFIASGAGEDAHKGRVGR